MIPLRLQSEIHRALKSASLHDEPRSEDAASPYGYSALPNDTSIRLLNIHPGASDTVSCSLEIVDLDDNPRYDCLSYTWQDPRIPLFQSVAPTFYRRKHIIRCGASIISVNQNLHDSLLQLRSSKNRGSTKFSQCIWIDAICINQDDLDERSAQVQIMDRIYAGAQLVVGWLGRSCVYSARAQHVVNHIHSSRATPPEDTGIVSSLIRRGVSTLLGPNVASQLPMAYIPLEKRYPSLTPEDFNILVATLKLPYFQRAWILQEVMLAPKMVFRWGEFDFHAPALETCAAVITEDEEDNWRMVKSSLFASLPDRMKKSSLSQLGPSIGLAKSNREINIYTGSRIPWWALISSSIGRGFAASDPRDHVYASLSWVKKLIQNCPSTEPVQLSIDDLPKPDYTKSTAQVFTEIATWQMKISNSLFPLQNKEDPSVQNPALRDDLPSWVTDLSVPVQPTPLYMNVPRTNPWRPSGPVTSEDFGLPLGDESLVIRGAYFDVISSVALEFSDIPSADCLISVLNLIMPMLRMRYPVQGISYVEALWRTMTADSDMQEQQSFQLLAGAYKGRSFNEWLVSRAGFFEGSPADNASFDSESHYEAQRMLLHETLYQATNSPEMFSAEPFNEANRSSLEEFDRAEKKVFARGCKRQGESIYNRQELARFVRVFAQARVADASQQLFSMDQVRSTIMSLQNMASPRRRWLIQRAERFGRKAKPVITSRCLVMTRGGYLGIVASSVQAGDQVWLVPNLSTPMILRPAGAETFKLVGDSYVHGIMHGEAFSVARIEFQDIELV